MDKNFYEIFDRLNFYKIEKDGVDELHRAEGEQSK